MELNKKIKVLNTPLSSEDVLNLKAGDVIYISGKIITARDLAYKRILSQGPPFDMSGLIIYNCGPLAVRRDNKWRIVSAGPTTSSRMEHAIPKILEITGAKGIIGKGSLGKIASEALKKFSAFYGLFPGGAGALAAKSIVNVENVYWLNLGIPEAIWVLNVRMLGPIIVAIDAHGRRIFMNLI